MYGRILVATDGSPQAAEATRRAGDLAAAIGLAQVHVVSACHPYSLSDLQRIRTELPAEFRDLIDSQIEAEVHLGDATEVLAAAGVEAVHHVATGDPADAILRTADEIGAELIVVGARGLNSVGRFLRGSVSTRIAHHSTCDVLIVEPDATDGE